MLKNKNRFFIKSKLSLKKIFYIFHLLTFYLLNNLNIYYEKFYKMLHFLNYLFFINFSFLLNNL